MLIALYILFFTGCDIITGDKSNQRNKIEKDAALKIINESSYSLSCIKYGGVELLNSKECLSSGKLITASFTNDYTGYVYFKIIVDKTAAEFTKAVKLHNAISISVNTVKNKEIIITNNKKTVSC